MKDSPYLLVTISDISVVRETTKAALISLENNNGKYCGFKFWLPKNFILDKSYRNNFLMLSVPSDFTFHLSKQEGFKVVSDVFFSVKELQSALGNVTVQDKNVSLPSDKSYHVNNDELLSYVKVIDIFSINNFLDKLSNRSTKQTVTSLEPIAKEIGISAQTLEQLIYKREKLDRTRLVTLRKIQFYIDK